MWYSHSWRAGWSTNAPSPEHPAIRDAIFSTRAPASPQPSCKGCSRWIPEIPKSRELKRERYSFFQDLSDDLVLKIILILITDKIDPNSDRAQPANFVETNLDIDNQEDRVYGMWSSVLISLNWKKSVASYPLFSPWISILTVVVLVHVLIQVRGLTRGVRRGRWRRLRPVLTRATRRSHGDAVIRFHADTDAYPDTDFLAHGRRGAATTRQHRRIHLLALRGPAEIQAHPSKSLSRRLQTTLLSSQSRKGSSFGWGMLAPIFYRYHQHLADVDIQIDIIDAQHRKHVSRLTLSDANVNCFDADYFQHRETSFPILSGSILSIDHTLSIVY